MLLGGGPDSRMHAAPAPYVEPADSELSAQRRRLLNIFAGMAVAAVVLEGLGLRGLVIPPHTRWAGLRIVNLPYMATALLGSLLSHLLTRPRRAELLVTGLLALALPGLALVWQARQGAPAVPSAQVLSALGAWLGLASLLVMLVQTLRARGAARTRRLVQLLGAAALPAYVTLSMACLDLTATLHPRVYDGYVYAADTALLIRANLLVHRLFVAVPVTEQLARAIYLLLPLAVAMLYIGQSAWRRRPPVDTLLLFMVAGAAGMCIYHILPVVGPYYLFHYAAPPDYPPAAQVPLLSLFAPLEPRNCMPSLHTTWGLLLWWQTRGQSLAVRAGAAAFLGFTVLATLGFGFHYLCDLIAAVPFSVAVWSACATALPLFAASRLQPLLCGAGLTALWLILVRHGQPVLSATPAVPWALAVFTLVVSLGLRLRLQRALE